MKTRLDDLYAGDNNKEYKKGWKKNTQKLKKLKKGTGKNVVEAVQGGNNMKKIPNHTETMKKAYTDYYKLLEKPVYSFALKLTKNEEDAKDLAQDAWMRSYEFFDTFKPNTNFNGWIFTLVKNLFINNYRKVKRRNGIIQVTNADLLNYTNVGGGINDGECNLTLEQLVQYIHTIDADQAVAFVMAYEGFKYEEIKEYMGIPMGTVKSRIFHTRKKLMEMIKDEMGTSSKK